MVEKRVERKAEARGREEVGQNPEVEDQKLTRKTSVTSVVNLDIGKMSVQNQMRRHSLLLVKKIRVQDDRVLLVVDSKSQQGVWILDSGCLFHMTPNKAWFDTYEKVATRSVLTGNDAPCKVVGMGFISIKMHDGVVRTLTDVRHVPALKKNLISSGALDSKGFKYILRVSKGALVVMKGVKKGT